MENRSPDYEEASHHLAGSIEELNKSVQQGNSLLRNFGIALVRGIGYALGATLIASLLATVLVKTGKYIPYFKDINLGGIEKKLNE